MAQHVRHRALHAEADPGEPGLDQGSREAGVTESGLASVVTSASGASPNVSRSCPQQAAQFVRGQQRRRAAAEEDGG
jgi:hypothetical protein